MNRLILTLFAAFAAVCAQAQHVTDNLHLMSASEVSELESHIGSRPIYIETLDSVPNADLKAYADQKVQSLTANGKAVLIVVTIHPKSWRISEWPHGLLSVQSIGDEMASQFKRGQFYAGFNGAARDIDYAVTHRQANAPTAPPVTRTVTTTTTHTQTHTQARPVVYRSDSGDAFLFVFFCLFGLGVLILLIWAIVEACTPPPTQTVVIHDRDDDSPSYSSLSAPAGRPSPSTARDYYRQYSPAQRQAIVNNYVGQPGYYPGIYRNPMDFYMFLLTMNALTSHPYYGYGYGMGPNGYMAAPVTDQTTDTTTTTTTETTQSRSDDSGSSGGWGSSSSSSDDSGSSGSWGSSSSDSGSSGGWDSGSSGGSDFGSSSGGGDGGGGSW